MVDRQEIIDFMRQVGVPEYKIAHSDLVADVAVSVGRRVKKAGHSIDLETVEMGALLHDLGISKTGDDLSPQHAAIGADMARKQGFSEAIARCIESHELLGLPKDEAEDLGIPINRETFVPQNWEEKVVMFADHVVLGWGECLKDLWSDPLSISKACYPYLKKVYQRWAKKDVTPDHPSTTRGIEVYREMMPFLKPGDLEKLEDKAKKMRDAQINYGLEVPFPYEEDLQID